MQWSEFKIPIVCKKRSSEFNKIDLVQIYLRDKKLMFKIKK